MSDAWDQSRFDELLTQEVIFTRRNYIDAINTHAYFIARKALWLTKKADAARLRAELEGPAKFTDGTLGEAIMLARYRKQGGWPSSGSAFASDIARLIAAKTRSVGFLKSGWLPAIRTLEHFTVNKSQAAPLDRDARVYGQEKGSGYPAVAGDIMTAQITNSAGTEKAKGTAALHKYGSAALDTAFYDEAERMKEFIHRRLREQFDNANRNL